MPGQDCRAGAGSDPKARYVNPDSGTRPPVETKRGRAARSPLAPEDGRHPELTRNLYSAHRWASKAKRPAWGTPVPVFRFLVPSRRAPGTVHNSPGMEIQFCTELNLWVKPQHNPKQKARGLALGLAPKTPVPAHNRGKSGPKPRSKSKGGYPEGSFCPSSGSLTRFLQGPETRMRPPGHQPGETATAKWWNSRKNPMLLHKPRKVMGATSARRDQRLTRTARTTNPPPTLASPKSDFSEGRRPSPPDRPLPSPHSSQTRTRYWETSPLSTE